MRWMVWRSVCVALFSAKALEAFLYFNTSAFEHLLRRSLVMVQERESKSQKTVWAHSQRATWIMYYVGFVIATLLLSELHGFRLDYCNACKYRIMTSTLPQAPGLIFRTVPTLSKQFFHCGYIFLLEVRLVACDQNNTRLSRGVQVWAELLRQRTRATLEPFSISCFHLDWHVFV